MGQQPTQMPIEFACLHCQQKLSVTSRKVGSRAKCPKCNGIITVPTAEEGAAMLEMRRAARQEEPDDPLSEFVVYDDELELDYDTGGLSKSAGEELPVDRTKVAVPRNILYMQGVLLGVVAWVAFALGMILGGCFQQPAASPAEHQPATLTGKLTYTTIDDQPAPDVGSVVLVLPVDKKPDEKVAIDGLRPDEPPPCKNHLAVAAIQSLGGEYARADTNGEFEVNLARSGRYYVLLVSGNAKCKRNELPKRTDLVQMGRYLLLASELIGQNKYRWTREGIRGSTPLKFEFGKSRF